MAAIFLNLTAVIKATKNQNLADSWFSLVDRQMFGYLIN
jgi:hypothetical protein